MESTQKSFITKSGERYCLLLNDDGLPLYYPNLYITTQVRNKSLSFSAMVSALNGIAILIRFANEVDEDFERRFSKHEYLNESELDALRDYCQRNFRNNLTLGTSEGSKNISLLGRKVASQTEYNRLSVIANYLRWLGQQTVGQSRDKDIFSEILKMEKSLKSRRPVKRNRNSQLHAKGLTKEQIQVLFKLVDPNSTENPFHDHATRVRNRLIFSILLHLGLRGGELLNLRCRDIGTPAEFLIVARRADEIEDPRTDQPLVKTLDRRIRLNDKLAQYITEYISLYRAPVSKVAKHDFLFVTHKTGPNKGQPLSKSAYKKIMSTIRAAEPELYNLSGHKLRHSWNEAFSEYFDSQPTPPSHEEQEKLRSYLMGWKEGSGTASIYNTRFIRKKAMEASLELQSQLVRLPNGLDDE